MDLPGLNPRAGKVVEAEILRKFGTSVCVHPSSRARGFFLVLSVGRCKYHLTVDSVGRILQATIGGSAPLFHVQLLRDRVFRFTVASQEVGFHIYSLHFFECSNYKVFFHLWHRSGPNYVSEFRQWSAEEAAKWKTVSKQTSSSPAMVPPLTGTNAILVSPRIFPVISNSNSKQGQRQSAITHTNYGSKLAVSAKINISKILKGNGILGKRPDFAPGPPSFCSRCLG